MHYFQKIKDYDKAVEWMEKAAEKPGKDPVTGKNIGRPGFVDRMLAHAYERTSNFDKTIKWEGILIDKTEAQWRKCLTQSEKMLKKHLANAANPVYYLTGPGRMVSAMRELLNSLGVNDDDIKTEEFTGYP
jgi:hypothetical protein